MSAVTTEQVAGPTPLLEPIVYGAWTNAPRLYEDDLQGTFWTFGAQDREWYSRFLVLAPEGLIGNYHNPNQTLWEIRDGRLCFIDDQGVATTAFVQARVDGWTGRLIALAGPVLIPGFQDFVHVLTRTDHPPHPLGATPPEVERRATFLAQLGHSPRRPNLVVVRANETSLHPRWMEELPDGQRSWDLCVSYYGDNPSQTRGEYEYLTHQPKQRKFQAIFDLFYQGSPLWQYDRIWLPDDDLLCTWADILKIFHLSRKYGLDLAQPSLKRQAGGSIAYDITAQRPESVLRYEGFVETMCPVFSRRALQICIGSFKDSVFGWGLDNLWPHLIGTPITRIAILDAVGIVHTRPPGGSYDCAAAANELRHLVHAYGVAECPLHYDKALQVTDSRLVPLREWVSPNPGC